MLAAFKEMGISVLMSAKIGENVFYYMDTEPLLGIIYEFVKRAGQTMSLYTFKGNLPTPNSLMLGAHMLIGTAVISARSLALQISPLDKLHFVSIGVIEESDLHCSLLFFELDIPNRAIEDDPLLHQFLVDLLDIADFEPNVTEGHTAVFRLHLGYPICILANLTISAL